MEIKHKKFKRLLEKRLARVLKELNLVANLSTNRYYFSEEEANQLLETLNNKVKYVEGLFQRRLSLHTKKK